MKATLGARSAVDAVVLHHGECDTGIVWPHCTRDWLPKKSERLSAPLATGLMGMQENYFLNAFFDCMAFMSMTTQSEIRETIVKMMTSVPKPEVAPLSQEHGVEAEANIHILPDVTSSLKVSGDDKLWGAKGSSLCVLWSAIALGALSIGRPTESVSSYVRLAINALQSSKDSSAAEIVRAWCLLGQAVECSGDMEGFKRFLHSTEAFIQETIWRGQVGDIPSWLIDSIDFHKENTILITEDSKEILASFRSKKISPPPEICSASSDTEIYVFISRTKTKIYQAMCGCYGGGGRRALTMSEHDSNETLEGLHGAEQPKAQSLQARHSTIDEGLDIAAVERLGSALSMAGPLELLVQRPNIRGGAVEACIQSTLAIEKATKRDYRGAMGHLQRSVEVVERYPGQLRCLLGSHAAHFVASFLVILDEPKARELYNRMRAMYNPFRAPDCGSIPPFERWEGVRSCCHNMLCRLMEDIVTLLLRSQPPHDSTCNDGACSEVGLVGVESTSSFAEEGQHSIVADKKRVELLDPGEANDDGYIDCDREGYPTGSISLTASADRRPTEPEDIILQTREAITFATPRFEFGCLPTAAVGSPLAEREQKGTTSLLVVDGGSGSNNEYVKSMEEEEENDVSPQPKYYSKGNTRVEPTLHKEDKEGRGSSSNRSSYPIDITAEDWLHVAATVHPMPTT